MKYIKFIFQFLRLLLLAIVQWISNILALIKRLQTVLARDKRKTGTRLDKVSTRDCIPLQHPAYQRPDPLIYSQNYLMSKGLAVTWDNPDIHLEKDGIRVSSDKITADTEYDIVARIWNGSYQAPIVGLPVSFSFMGFGIGAKKTDIGKTSVNLGVKGGPDHPAVTRIKWRTPGTPGHYCIQVAFKWADDSNPNNNIGQENTNVALAASPARFSFAIRNEYTDRLLYRLEADTYVLPELAACDERGHRDERQLAAMHSRGNHPIPEGWVIEYSQSEMTLEPDEERQIEVVVTPPDDFSGSKAININAFTAKGLAGGVTVFITKN